MNPLDIPIKLMKKELRKFEDRLQYLLSARPWDKDYPGMNGESFTEVHYLQGKIKGFKEAIVILEKKIKKSP